MKKEKKIKWNLPSSNRWFHWHCSSYSTSDCTPPFFRSQSTSKTWNIKFYITFVATWSFVAGNMRNKMCLFLFLFFMECYLGMSSFSFVCTSLVLLVFASSEIAITLFCFLCVCVCVFWILDWFLSVLLAVQCASFRITFSFYLFLLFSFFAKRDHFLKTYSVPQILVFSASW